MKTKFSKLTFAIVCTASAAVFTFSGCQDKPAVSPGDIAAVTRKDAAVSKEDFDATLKQALEAVDESNHCEVKKVEGGYNVIVSPGPGNAELRVVCEGGGASFIRCIKGYVDGGNPVVISTCHGHYCGSI